MSSPLTRKDLVKLGMHESGQGYTLNQIEADFLKKGIKRKDAIRALKEIEHSKKIEEARANKEESLKKQAEQKAAVNAKQQTEQTAQAQEKSSFWPWIILVIIIGFALYALYLIFWKDKF